MHRRYCGLLGDGDIGQDVELCGWVHRRRDHGGVIFLDVRDHEGVVQVVFDPDIVPKRSSMASSILSCIVEMHCACDFFVNLL